MNFKHYDNADQFLNLLENEVECDCCHLTKKCFEATLHNAVCRECLSTGQLSKLNPTNCNGDINELKRQLKDLNPNFSLEQLEKIAKSKTNVLEATTPLLVSWQDWDWPCADGDYCKFIGYGSQQLYNKLHKDGHGRELFESSFYYKIKDVSDNTLWDNLLPENENCCDDYDTVFYVFKSLNSDKIITTWDCA